MMPCSVARWRRSGYDWPQRQRHRTPTGIEVWALCHGGGHGQASHHRATLPDPRLVLEADTQRMTGYSNFLRGPVVALLLGGAFSASCSMAQPAPAASRRVSECGFHVVLQTRTGEPDVNADLVLDTAAAIARRTGAVTINGTYAREERVNDFRALEAIAIRHGGRVRDLLVTRGVTPDVIRLIGLPSHPPDPSQSGAYVHVCARGRNVENGWRERPLDPSLLVRVRVGTAVLHVPIVNLGPYTWNNVPAGEASLFQFNLDRADDPATFIEVQARCFERGEDPSCRRRIMVQVQPGPYRAPGGDPPQSRRVVEDDGEGRVMLTRQWAEGSRSVASMRCSPPPQRNSAASIDTIEGEWRCSGLLHVVPDRVAAAFWFVAGGEAEAEAIVTRARRDFERFAATEPGR